MHKFRVLLVGGASIITLLLGYSNCARLESTKSNQNETVGILREPLDTRDLRLDDDMIVEVTPGDTSADSKAGAVPTTWRYWPNGEIPLSFESTMTTEQKNIVRMACDR